MQVMTLWLKTVNEQNCQNIELGNSTIAVVTKQVMTMQNDFGPSGVMRPTVWQNQCLSNQNICVVGTIQLSPCSCLWNPQSAHKYGSWFGIFQVCWGPNTTKHHFLVIEVLEPVYWQRTWLCRGWNWLHRMWLCLRTIANLEKPQT